jgi:hypothetical protein
MALKTHRKTWNQIQFGGHTPTAWHMTQVPATTT